MTRQRHDRGFGALVALLVLVVLATISAGVLRLSTAQSLDQSQALQALRADQAARAGIEWGLYQAVATGGSWSACSGTTHTADLSADLGMHVTITCNSAPYNEGESAPGTPQSGRVYTIDAVACNSGTCPDSSRATLPTYVERRRSTIATSLP